MRTRGDELRDAYIRQIRIAFAISAALHLLLAAPFRNALPWFAPRSSIGYPGRIRLVHLAPMETSVIGNAPVDRPRSAYGMAGGAGRITGDGAPSGPSRLGEEGEFSTEAGIGGPSEGGHRLPRIELGEDWRVWRVAAPVAQSETFQVLKIVRPLYPELAVLVGSEGLIKLEAVVDSTGKVARARVMEHNVDNRDLEHAALEAMRQWEFLPYRQNGRPTAFTVVVPFRFKLID